MTHRASAAFTTEWRHFDLTIKDHVATLVFARPDRLNALTYEVYADLRDLLAELPLRDDVSVLVITGKGRAFCSGGDLKQITGELLEADPRGLLEFTRMSGAVIERMRNTDLPIIAAINGVAAGAGAVLALAADFRLFSSDASLQFLFTQVGLTGADMGVAYLLPRMVGLARATEFLMLGDRIDAESAERVGLANQIVAPEQLEEAAGALARRLADGPTLAYGATKSLINRELDMSFSSAVELEAWAQALMIKSSDHSEFIASFRDKRKPLWTGR